MPIVHATITPRVPGIAVADPQASPLPRHESSQWRRTAYRYQETGPLDPDARIEGQAAFEERLVTDFKKARRQANLLRLTVFGFHQDQSRSNVEPSQRTIAEACRKSLGEDCFLARYRSNQYCAVQTDVDVDAAFRLAHPFAWPVQDSGLAWQTPSVALAIALPRWGGCSFERFLAAAENAIEATPSLPPGAIRLASCLDERDQALLHEVSRRRFSRFLASRSSLTSETVKQATTDASGPTESIGRLARRLKWLGPRRLRRILLTQRSRRKLFGQVAVELGYLSEDQVLCLLALQRENPEKVAYHLLEQGVWSTSEAQKTLREYYANLQGGVSLLRSRTIIGRNLV